MLFQNSKSGVSSIGTSAIELWGDCEILWECCNVIKNHKYVEFLLEKDKEYWYANYKIYKYFDGDLWYDDNEYNSESFFKKHSKHFKDVNELLLYGKQVKKKFDKDGGFKGDKREALLLVIKKEYYSNMTPRRNRIDDVE